ncbi:TQO small subunit DoxD [Chryseobacterium sp. BIGb0232]|uniref:TQO small subunit DoxD n=1 Tax=Chryseobacterium sp. BIGb0232 TaxID=2940598 RepID=UPI000F465BA0|nr:TQO small subunit DoxD [Chryseobacterium sp. BIGb0232]MCS4301265.1 thiosulfate dehydrogenase [quinone] large subunit [Chryseobacterium sp. BIGb0232]ROS19875.1 thiosulfate dehydrogenase [quinone] large subunit [Chryseobacterium nakagawai]
MKHTTNSQSYDLAGLYTLSLRMVIGWTYFSAFWRRLVLENKLIPDEKGYIGEKFNHFLPNALGIKPIIEYLVTHPDALQRSMMTFTIIEAIVGLFIILGLFTRLMSIGIFSLALGILLGSGWLGTTCVDEWQIGVLGVAGGFVLFLTGSGAYSLDDYFIKKNKPFTQTKWFQWLGSGILPIAQPKVFVLAGSLLIFGLTLYTNQYFHGGVWGTLHNKSVKPKLEISNISHNNSELTFEVFRTEGADVYGSFLIGIHILDKNGNILKEIDHKELSKFSKGRIKNHYVAKVKPGKHSLIIPLGAKADVNIGIDDILQKDEIHTLKLIDISGIEWIENVN